MKKRNIKPLVLSSLAALGLASISAAGTFALFTDKAETTVNIGAGKVIIGNAMTIQEAYSLNLEDANTIETGNKVAHYVNGGLVKINDTAGETTSIDVTKWTPGDGAKFRTAPVNSSNVTIKVRMKIAMSGQLAPALVTEVRNASATGNALLAAKGQRTLVTDWVPLEPGVTPAAFDLDIYFPNHGDAITFREEGIDNPYQERSATIVISYEAVQGNADVSASLLEKINAKLATEEVADGARNFAMFDAVQDLAGVATLDEIKEKAYVWGFEDDQFHESSAITSNKNKYFKVANEVPDADGFSVYAADNWDIPAVSLSGIGFDAGNAQGITSISYVGVTAARENVIRTNSAQTDLTVNAPLDTVHHYGNAGSVDIIAAANQSYHENGKVAFMEVAKGRVVLENESKVEQIHISTKVTEVNETTGEKTKQANVFDEIKIAYAEEVETLPVFSRDPVQIADGGTLVVELQKVEAEEVKSNEYVWLYQQGLKEQIRVTEEKEVTAEQLAAAPKSTDEAKVEEKTATAAMQIANNLGGGKTYEQLVQEEKIAEDGSIKETEVATLALVEEGGLSSDALEETKVEAIEEAVSDEVVEKAEPGIKYVARIGDVGYESLSAAILAAKEGETVRLIEDITVNEYVDGINYSGNKCYVKKLPHGVTLDGGNHTVTMTEQEEETVLISDLYGNIKNIVVAGLNGPVCGDVEMGAVFQGVTAKGAFDVDGNVGAFAIYAWLDSSHPSNKLTFIDCVNEVDLTGTGTAADYNAAFLGYMVHNQNYEVTFTRCINKGKIICGSGGLFIANPRGYTGKVYVNNCRNDGLIQRTYDPESLYRVNQLIYGTVSDYATTTIIDGVTYTMAQVKSRQAELAIPGNPLVLGSANSQLSLVKNNDGTFTFHGTEGAAYYEMSVGLYVGTGSGSTRDYVKQTITAVESQEYYTTDIKDLRFVDKQWLDAHEGAVISNPDWNGQVRIVSYENNQYFLLSNDTWECNGEITPSELIAIAAFDANGHLIASTGI